MIFVTLSQAALFAAILLGLYSIAVAVIRPPARAAVKAIRMTGEKARKSPLQVVLAPIRKLIASVIRIPRYRWQKMRADLARLNMDMTPEEYAASAWAVSLLMGALAIPCWLAGSSISAIGCVVLAITMYFHEMQTIDRSLEDLDDRIVGELPGFVRSLTAGIESRLPLSDSVASYLNNKQDSAMKQELLKLTSSLGLGNQREALLEFETEIGLPQMRTVIPVLIAVTEGTSDNGQLIMLANQMDALAEERLQQILMKRPGKVKRATLIIMVCAVFQMIVPLIAQIIDGFAVAFG